MSRVSAPKRPYFGARPGGVRMTVGALGGERRPARVLRLRQRHSGGTGDPGRAAIRASETMANRRRGMISILSSGGCRATAGSGVAHVTTGG